MRRIHRFALLFAAVAITGCTSVPFDYPKEPSVAFAPSSDSRIARDTEAWVYANDGSSGFVPLTDGMDALGARLRMMEQAQISIDAQYFLIKPDTAGALFAAELLEAADRGVKVRFLIDDIFTPNLDQQLGALDAHPNIEVRLFNPLSRQSFRAWSLLTDFKRANRRMHNKAFIVDNSVTIVGGRNIAAEYFQIDDDVEFVDFEIVGFGPVARKVSNTFDIFWNSEFSVPVSAFVDEPAPEDLLNLRDRLPPELVEATLTVYNEALTTQYLQDINDGVIVPVAARARVVTDLPNKLTTSTRDSEAKELAAVLREHGDDAEREIIIVTPYFVPGDTLANTLLAYVNQGIRVVVVTNSLASTNHVPVHSGYARYRKRLVEAGVEIYEDGHLGDAAHQGGDF
jgi:putative cardiolipin synthase